MIALLGQATDAEVAAELGISKSGVTHKRIRLGIPPHVEPPIRHRDRFWTPRRVVLLGTTSDKKLARRLGILPDRVGYQRRKRGIPPFDPGPPKVVWTAAVIRQLGRISDYQIAKQLGVSRGTVGRERQRHGIPPVTRYRQVLRNPELRRLLRLQTGEVVKRVGLPQSTVRRLRADLGMRQPGKITVWTPKALRDLGHVPDEVLAARLGLKPATVQLKRLQLGIKFRPARRWTKEEDDLVRSFPLAEVARRTGRTPASVKSRRVLLGVRSPSAPQPWTKREDDLVRRLPVAEVARRTGRTLRAVYHRRSKFGL